MKSVPKLIRRFIGILMLSIIQLLILNVTAFFSIASMRTPNVHPWKTAQEIAEALQKTDGGYILADDISIELDQNQAWAILIDNNTHQVIWHTDTLPSDIPLTYSLTDIASLTRGYIQSYPTFTGMVYADKDLLKRAVSNLIQNSISHYEDSCNICVSVNPEETDCVIRVEDDGVGATDEEITRLNNTPHYMVCDSNIRDQRHGLGLMIVRQIAASHDG